MAREITHAERLGSFELRLERLDDLARQRAYFLQRVIDSNAVAEAYKEGSLQFYVKVRFWPRDSDRDATEFHLCVQGDTERVWNEDLASVHIAVVPFERDTNFHLGGRHKDGLDQTMLVVVREIIQKGERVGAFPLPTSVWLKAADGRSMSLCESVQKRVLDMLSSEVIDTPRARKHGLLGGIASGIHERELVNKLIQSASVVVDGVPDENAESDRQRLHRGNDDDPSAILWIEILPGSCSWRLCFSDKALKRDFKGADVSVSPVQLRPYPS